MKRNSGIAFHCHHDVLAEYVWDYNNRVEYIKKHKPSKEVELRLGLFKLIPNNKLPSNLRKAWLALEKAGTDLDKAEAYLDEAEAYSWTGRDYGKALANCCKARANYSEAVANYRNVFTEPALEKLHGKLCPNCPWNGKTIFPEEVKEDAKQLRN